MDCCVRKRRCAAGSASPRCPSRSIRTAPSSSVSRSAAGRPIWFSWISSGGFCKPCTSRAAILPRKAFSNSRSAPSTRWSGAFRVAAVRAFPDWECSAVRAVELGGADRRAAPRPRRLAELRYPPADRAHLRLACLLLQRCDRRLRRGAGAGNPGHALDFLYFYIGSFVGGGIVLNGSLYPGRSGNAGALGSLPVPASSRAGSSSQQLIRSASIYVLEQQLLAAGGDPGGALQLTRRLG